MAGTVEAAIRQKLNAAFSPQSIEIVNESDSHSGHAGHDGSGESHFRVYLVSDKFAGQNRVARQRAIYDVLADELAGPIHAFSVTARSPDEIG